VLTLEPLADKWRAFGWAMQEVDGHDVEQLVQAFEAPPRRSGQPTAVIAHTIKGKGVSFMEGKLAWHYKSPDDGQLAEALRELGVAP
jgi:transketolase